MTDDRFSEVAERGGEAGYRPQFVDVDGTRTRYYDVGSGEPIVLLHGGIWGDVFNANTWVSCFDALSRDFRVIAFDRVACGLTDNPDDVDEYHWSTELEHAFSTLDALDVETCHLVGSSRGGGLAARMAVDAADRFDSLILLNSATFGPSAGDRAYRGDRLFERCAPGHDPTDPESVRFTLEQYAYRTDHITEEHCQACAWMRNRPTARETNEVMETGRRAVYEQSKEAAMRATHDRIKQGALTLPTLLLFGRNDLTVPLQTGLSAFDLIAQHNPDVRLELLNQCAHMPYRELPDEFAQTLTDFVGRLC